MEANFWNLNGLGNHKEVLSRKVMTRGSTLRSSWLHGCGKAAPGPGATADEQADGGGDHERTWRAVPGWDRS